MRSIPPPMWQMLLAWWISIQVWSRPSQQGSRVCMGWRFLPSESPSRRQLGTSITTKGKETTTSKQESRYRAVVTEFLYARRHAQFADMQPTMQRPLGPSIQRPVCFLVQAGPELRGDRTKQEVAGISESFRLPGSAPHATRSKRSPRTPGGFARWAQTSAQRRPANARGHPPPCPTETQTASP